MAVHVEALRVHLLVCVLGSHFGRFIHPDFYAALYYVSPSLRVKNQELNARNARILFTIRVVIELLKVSIIFWEECQY